MQRGKKKIKINKTISRVEFWRMVKNLNAILRMKKAKDIHYWYNMPAGGMSEGKYHIGWIEYNQTQK